MAQDHLSAGAGEVSDRADELHRPDLRQVREPVSDVRQVLREQAQVGVHRERVRHLLRGAARQAQPEAQHSGPAHKARAAHHEVSAHAQGDQEVHGEGGQVLRVHKQGHRHHDHGAQERRRHDERGPPAGLRGPHHRSGPPPSAGHAARARARGRQAAAEEEEQQQQQRSQGQAQGAQGEASVSVSADHNLQRDDRLKQEIHQPALHLQV